MKKTNIVVTGGLGNIGSSLVKQLIKDKKNYIYIIDNLYTGKLSKLPNKKYKNWKYLKINVNSKSSFNKNFNKIKINYFSFAHVGVQRTLKSKKSFEDIDGIKHN